MPGNSKRSRNGRESLVSELTAPEGVRQQPRKKARTKRKEEGVDIDADGHAAGHTASSSKVPEEVASKVLKIARSQQHEIEEELEDGAEGSSRQEDFRWEVESDASSVASSQGSEMDVAMDEFTAEEEAQFKAFLQPSGPKRTIADIIEEKLQAMKSREGRQEEAMDQGQFSSVKPRVVEVYKDVGKFLSKYKSGKVPKPFKLIPALSNWEEVLWITDPDSWSNQAVYQATRLFASNLNDKNAARFYNLVLLPRVRDDIQTNKKLNFHLYQASKKAAYKPAAFYKGLILPLIGSGDCSLQEAVIAGSVIRRVTLPVVHSAAALCKVSAMEYSGAQSLLITAILDKRYALPKRVLHEVVMHFDTVSKDERDLPVKWHVSLLTFVQRYKFALSAEQQDCLKGVLKRQPHHMISQEVRRELNAAPAAAGAGSKQNKLPPGAVPMLVD